MITLEELKENLEQASKFGPLVKREDGKYDMPASNSLNDPWQHFHDGIDNGCDFWGAVMDQIPGISKHDPNCFIPSSCQECWKVVVKPQTIEQLFQLAKIEERLGITSKCGIEERWQVAASYGGYFYGTSKEEGLRIYDIVRTEVDINIGTIPVFLKRGCTEYEITFGDSLYWEVSAEQLPLEDYLITHIYPTYRPMTNKEFLLGRTHEKWYRKAHSIGDMGYVKFRGKPYFEPYRTYHDR